MTTAEAVVAKRGWIDWVSTLPVFFILIAVIFFSSNEAIHAQLLKLGEQLWPGYFQLRVDPAVPDCALDMDIDAEVRRLVNEAEAEAEIDEFDLFGSEPVDEQAIRQSVQSAAAACVQTHQTYENFQTQITPQIDLYRSLETGLAELSEFALRMQRLLLGFLVLICATTATLRSHHIALRAPRTQLDHWVSGIAQVIANGYILASALVFRQVVYDSGVPMTGFMEAEHYLWGGGLTLLLVVSLIRLFYVPKHLPRGDRFFKALLTIPLYSYFALISGTLYFMRDYVSGIAIAISSWMELAQLFLKIGLFVWIGMLLKQTRIASLMFTAIRPWKLPPELLVVVVVVLAALPTAYTGASGIFVIAVGAVIYQELRREGTRRQLALAATAMSGSMGVVLRPCILVVIIAYLNREVTTSMLFDWGFIVFSLTALMLLLAVVVTRRESIQVASPKQAVPQILIAMRPLVPYIGIFIAMILFYALVLNAYLDEFSASMILPVIMLIFLAYEKWFAPKHLATAETKDVSFEQAVRNATEETSVHIGALLFMMGVAVTLGGLIEGLGESALPQFENVYAVMLFLVVILVVIGMVIDPMAGVFVVTLGFSGYAYSNGIHPVHFWMVTLVAFEMGYLSPPVALNHLLTRTVVGVEEVDRGMAEGGTFWERYERYILPLAVMGTSLVIVAFLPLLAGVRAP